MIATIFKVGQREGEKLFPLTPPSTHLHTHTYLYLLGALVEVVLSFLGVLHQLGVPALLQLLLVFQVGHLLRLVLHLPAHTYARVNTNASNVSERENKITQVSLDEGCKMERKM